MKFWEEKLAKENNKIKLSEEEFKIKEKDLKIKEEKQKVENERLIKKDEHLIQVAKELTNKEKDKSCFGVICNVEDDREKRFSTTGGNMVSIYDREKGDIRTFINSLGEGAIWVSNKNGQLESGDYITSSIIPGYGEKQDSEFLANYTVAKITMDCNFMPEQQKVLKIKKKEVEKIYYRSELEIPDGISKNEFIEHNLNYTYDESKNIIYNEVSERVYNLDKHLLEVKGYIYEKLIKNELENILDENGEFTWEETENYEEEYNLRYLLENGTIISKEIYDEKLSNNENVYIAAFVGCTYHCG